MRQQVLSALTLLIAAISLAVASPIQAQEDVDPVAPPAPAETPAEDDATSTDENRPSGEESKNAVPPEEITLPPPSEAPAGADGRPADGKAADRTPDEDDRLEGELNIRAPYTDVRVRGGDRPGVNVWTPWAGVRLGESGLRVDTPVGPILLGDEDRPIAPAPRERAVLGVLLENNNGVRIKEVREGSPAHEANLATGDRIVSVNGVSYGDVAAFQRGLARYRPGDRVRLTIERDGNRYQTHVVLTGYEDIFGSAG